MRCANFWIEDNSVEWLKFLRRLRVSAAGAGHKSQAAWVSLVDSAGGHWRALRRFAFWMSRRFFQAAAKCGFSPGSQSHTGESKAGQCKAAGFRYGLDIEAKGGLVSSQLDGPIFAVAGNGCGVRQRRSRISAGRWKREWAHCGPCFPVPRLSAFPLAAACGYCLPCCLSVARRGRCRRVRGTSRGARWNGVPTNR